MCEISMECDQTGCKSTATVRGFCQDHKKPSGKRVRAFGKKPKDAQCSVEGCGRAYLAKGFCGKHYHSHYRYNDATRRDRRERGSGSIKQGYRMLTVSGRQILEHRLVMEGILGRRLLPGENVHHKNGVRLDNRPENLELWSSSQPPGQRVTDKVGWAREIIHLYGGMVDA